MPDPKPVEDARTTLAKAEAALSEADAARAKAEAEAIRLDALSELKQADLLALINARHKLRDLDAQRPQLVQAIEDAKTALARAARARDLALVDAVRAEAAKIRDPLDAKLAILVASDDPAAAVWAMLEDDPGLAKIGAEMARLKTCAERAYSLDTLSPAERAVDLGPWRWFPSEGLPLFAALAREAKSLRARREEEAQAAEAARIRAEELAAQRAVKPRVLHYGQIEAAGAGAFKPGSNVAYVFSAEQAAALPRSPALTCALHDPHRAIVTFTEEALALAAAQDKRAAQALRAAAEMNAVGRCTRPEAPHAAVAFADDEDRGVFVVEADE